MPNIYAIAAFRSRNSVYQFESLMRRAGVPTSIISTPHEIAVGCGLSVKFDMRYMQVAIREYEQTGSDNLIGFYQVEAENGRTTLKPVYTARIMRC